MPPFQHAHVALAHLTSLVLRLPPTLPAHPLHLQRHPTLVVWVWVVFLQPEANPYLNHGLHGSWALFLVESISNATMTKALEVVQPGTCCCLSLLQPSQGMMSTCLHHWPAWAPVAHCHHQGAELTALNCTIHWHFRPFPIMNIWSSNTLVRSDHHIDCHGIKTNNHGSNDHSEDNQDGGNNVNTIKMAAMQRQPQQHEDNHSGDDNDMKTIMAASRQWQQREDNQDDGNDTGQQQQCKDNHCGGNDGKDSQDSDNRQCEDNQDDGNNMKMARWQQWQCEDDHSGDDGHVKKIMAVVTTVKTVKVVAASKPDSEEWDAGVFKCMGMGSQGK
ncbi:hypothetical protein EDB86DRAFT_2836295 [Lactarius hatsudake]|nr:hypothetical protein EDB86DRAFT_2836295 [Lactarius hatsudake]